MSTRSRVSSSSTSARAACASACTTPTGAVVHNVERELLPDSPADGIVRVRRARDGRHVPRARDRGASTHAGPVDAVGISEPARLDGRVGPRDRRAGRARHRLAGPAHGRRVPDAARRRACASARTSRRPSCSGCSSNCPTAAAARDLCFGTVDTWVAWTLSNGAVHVTDATNAAVTGLQVTRRPVGVGPARARRCSASRSRCCRRSSTRAASSARRPRCRARRRSRRCSATSRRRSSARAACGPGDAKITFGTGGMLDLVLGDTRPAFDQRGPAGTFPIVAWRHDGRVTWGIEAVMLAAGTNVQWLRDDLGLIATLGRIRRGRGAVRRHRRRRLRPRAARPRHARVGLRRARRVLRADARHRAGRRSCARCSKASRTAAPTSSRPPKPTAASRSRRCASTAA